MDRSMLLVPAGVRDGRLFLPHRDSFEAAIARWPDSSAVLRLEQSKSLRSLALNAYYWGVCIHQISVETGFREDEAHDLMKSLHLSRRLEAMRGGPICWQCARLMSGTSTRMSNGEFLEYLLLVHEWAVRVLGIYIPDPNEMHLVAA